MNRMIFGYEAGAIARATVALLVVAGCSTSQSPDRATVEIKGSDPAATAPATTSAPTAPLSTAPDASGVVTYDGYQAAVARSGDTVSSVAERIGLSASELGAYNGLSPSHELRSGDELVLPPRPGGYGTQPVAVAPAPAGAPAVAAAPIESVPLSGGTPAAPQTGQPTSATGGWSPAVAAAAIDRAAGFDNAGELGVPPSSTEPLPPAPEKPADLASPQLSQYQTPGLEPLAPEPPPRPVETITTPAEEPVEETAAIELAATAPEPGAELRLIRPATGSIVVGFNQGAGRARNDGIDFASPSGSPVVAAASGEVALVSQSLGGLGTIVLLRHPGDYLTVYGRIEKVKVVKGDLVSQGQRIGVVSPSPKPRMHFEVRHGAESLDPQRFF